MKTNILDVPIDCYTYGEVLAKAIETIKASARGCKIIITPNPEMIMLARKDKQLFHILKSVYLVIPDGIGVVLASKLNKIKIEQRVPGCDLCFSIFDNIKGKDYTVYLMGAAPGVAALAKAKMEEKFPGLTICGVHDGYFDEAEEQRIIEEINTLKPDVLLVGLNFPKQEKWLYHNRKKLTVSLAMAVGGSIDVMSGTVKRAPKIFQKLGLEWFYRLLKQPSRFFRMLALPKFAIVVLWKKMTGSGYDN